MFNEFRQGRLCITPMFTMQHSVDVFNTIDSIRPRLISFPISINTPEKRDRFAINVYSLLFPSDKVNSGTETQVYIAV